MQQCENGTKTEVPLHRDGHSSISTQDKPSRLLLHLFEYTLCKDAKLQEIFNTVPKNACYTSATVQNEITKTRSSVFWRKSFWKTCVGSMWVGIIFRDLTNTENISVVVRFVKEGKLHEVLIDMTTSINCDADALKGHQSWRGRMVKNSEWVWVSSFLTAHQHIIGHSVP